MGERTYLAWIKMAVTLGSIGAGLMAAGSDNSAEELGPDMDGVVSSGTTLAFWIGALFMPVGIAFALYSLHLFQVRDSKIRKNDFSMPKEHFPLLMGSMLLVSLISVL